MAVQVIGAGVGRTGTLSLKAGLERLLGRPCYHMVEVLGRPEQVRLWQAAAEGERVDWSAMLAGYGATTDFPACLFWREILEANPDAVVVLSTRRDAGSWWQSASSTIFAIEPSQAPPELAALLEAVGTLLATRFVADRSDRAATIAAYERHNAEVRALAPAGRLVEWQPGDGWGPLCAALGMPVPEDPFPHLNKREDFPPPDAGLSLPEVIERLAAESSLHGSS